MVYSNLDTRIDIYIDKNIHTKNCIINISRIINNTPNSTGSLWTVNGDFKLKKWKVHWNSFRFPSIPLDARK